MLTRGKHFFVQMLRLLSMTIVFIIHCFAMASFCDSLNILHFSKRVKIQISFLSPLFSAFNIEFPQSGGAQVARPSTYLLNMQKAAVYQHRIMYFPVGSSQFTSPGNLFSPVTCFPPFCTLPAMDSKLILVGKGACFFIPSIK